MEANLWRHARTHTRTHTYDKVTKSALECGAPHAQNKRGLHLPSHRCQGRSQKCRKITELCRSFPPTIFHPLPHVLYSLGSLREGSCPLEDLLLLRWELVLDQRLFDQVPRCWHIKFDDDVFRGRVREHVGDTVKFAHFLFDCSFAVSTCEHARVQPCIEMGGAGGGTEGGRTHASLPCLVHSPFPHADQAQGYGR